MSARTSRDVRNLTIFLTSTRDDVKVLVTDYLDFLVGSNYRSAVKSLKRNLPLFEGSVKDTLEILGSENYVDSLVTHGLGGDELERKFSLYMIARKTFYRSAPRILKQLQRYWNRLRNKAKEIATGRVKSIKDGLNQLKGIIGKLKDSMDTLADIVGRFIRVIDVILKSLGKVFPPAGLAEEFKESVEAVL